MFVVSRELCIEEDAENSLTPATLPHRRARRSQTAAVLGPRAASAGRARSDIQPAVGGMAMR